MARRALVEILGEASGFIAATKKSSQAAGVFSADLKKLSVNAKASADAQVAASVKKTSRLRAEVAAYREIAAAAGRGSKEQIAAANLAASAENRLARSMGVTAHEATRLRSSAASAEREVGRATRGALAGSGIFRGLGRSIAFASGGFLAFATAGQFLRASFDAAKEEIVVQRQLAAQFKASGQNLGAYETRIDALANRLALLAGVENDEVKAGFTTIFRTTNDVSKALRDTATAADLARAKHMSFAQASLIIAKTEAGNTTLLRRQGFQIAKNATAEQALAQLRATIAGQAKAGTTAQERFGAVLHNTEEIIGNGLLPAVNKELAVGAVWLTQMNETGRLQRDVATAAHDVGVAVHIAADGFHAASAVIRTVDKVTGGLENTLKDLAAVWLILKARMAINWAGTVLGMEATGAAAAAASGKVATLRAGLAGLNGYLAVATILVIERHQIKKAISHAVNDEDAGGPGDLLPVRKNGKWVDVATGKPVKDQAYWNAHTPVSRGGGTAAMVNRSAGFSGAGSDVPSPVNGRTGYTLGGQFNLLQLKLANAQLANNTAAQRSILVAEEKITLKLRDQAKTLAKRTELTNQAASLEEQIRGLDAQKTSATKKTVAAKAKQTKQAASGGVPLPLQLAEAKADAMAAGRGATDLTKSQISARKAIRDSLLKAIHSHKLSVQGMIDDWNQIASINTDLQSQTGKGTAATYHAVSTRAVTSGLGLTHGARVALEERLAQRAAHRGTAPNGPAALGQQVGGVNINGPITITGVRNIDELYTELQKVGKRRHQRRGQR